MNEVPTTPAFSTPRNGALDAEGTEVHASSIVSAPCRDPNGTDSPVQCKMECNINGYYDAVEIHLGTATVCNRDFVPDECDIASGSSADANENGIPYECKGETATATACRMTSTSAVRQATT